MTELNSITVKKILDEVKDFVLVLDSEFNIIYVNKVVESYGYKINDLLKKNVGVLLSKDTRKLAANSIRRFREDPIKYSTQTIIAENFHKDSMKKYEMEFKVSSFEIEGVNIGYCGIGRDITLRNNITNMETEINRLNNLMEICGGLCHELSQPIQILSGKISVLTIKINEMISIIKFGDSLTLTGTLNDMLNDMFVMNKQIERLSKILTKMQNAKKYDTKVYLKTQILDIETL